MKSGIKSCMHLGRVATLSLASVALLSLSASAQKADEMKQLMNTFSAPQQAILKRLDSFGSIKAAEWRMHEGDMAHGESPSLDDKAWKIVKPRTSTGAGSVWFRRWIEIPRTLDGYDSTGTRIWFRFRVNSSDISQIVYFNGRRVALGSDLEPIILTDSAKPGDKILVAVKLLQSSGDKRFDGADLKVEFASDRPNPQDLREEIIGAAALLPSVSTDPTADRKTLDEAVDAIDIKALDAHKDAAFDASLRTAEKKLNTLRPTLQKVTFHETGNSHIDAAWLWPWTETVDVVRRTFGTAAQLLNEYLKYTYTQSAAQYNEWIADKYPQLNKEVAQRIKEGRWEIVGGMWVEPDLNLPDGESLSRSILLGKRFYRKAYGVDVHIGWNPDSFGYNWQLPQIYKRSGIDTFVTQKMAWNDINQLPLKLFWWQSPDGSKVLTYFPHGYGNHDLNPVRLSVDMADARKLAPGLPSIMDLYGVGDHGGGPTRAMLDEGMHWSDDAKPAGKMQFGTADSYFKSIRGSIASQSPTWNYDELGTGTQTKLADAAPGQINIPTWNDELYLEYHRGVYTTQAGHKRGMRESEEQTLDAEKYSSLAWLYGKTYPADSLTEAWKKITFNGFHDLAAGSGIGVIYKDSAEDFNLARHIASEATTGAMNTLDARINTAVSKGVPVLVWNSLGWQRDGSATANIQFATPAEAVSILDDKGNPVPSHIVSTDAVAHTMKVRFDAPQVPSLGYAVYSAVPGGKPLQSALRASSTTLENEHLRIVVDPKTGCITSLFDKDANQESLASGACGNELQAFVDKPKDYDAWNIDPGTYDVEPTHLTTGGKVTLLENTPYTAAIQVERVWGKSAFTQTLRLDHAAHYLRVDTDVDWHEEHILLKASFPLAHTSDKASFEIPYGVIERPTTRNNSYEKARFEVPAIRWADLGDSSFGVSLLNDTKYGYDAAGHTLRITLLRSPDSPDPVADRGLQHMTYWVYPHAGSWKSANVEHLGYDLNYPLTAAQTMPHTGSLPASMSFVSADVPNVVITAMKKAEDSDALVLRLFETEGKASQINIKLPSTPSVAQSVSIMEDVADDESPVTLNGSTASFAIHPWQIVTLKVGYPKK